LDDLGLVVLDGLAVVASMGVVFTAVDFTVEWASTAVADSMAADQRAVARSS
jgi:hypothetical protein